MPALLLCATVSLSGCSISEPPQFVLNTEGRDPSEISLAQKEAILSALEKLFGTPDQPQAHAESGLQLQLLQVAAGPIHSDQRGRQWGLYRQHCVSCHGISGDGAGPTAAAWDPYPRDFRNGVFKYTSTAGGAKPVWEDLDRALRRGAARTSMPSFDTLPDEEVDALIEYVKYLSIRGETELFLLQLVVDEDEYPVQLPWVVEDSLVPVATSWIAARETVVVPPDPPPGDPPQLRHASIAAGRELYASKDAQCVQCHGPNGRGDGPQAGGLYDDRNRPKKGVNSEETKRLARLFRLPIQRLRPRDFTAGTFRGGSRPIDLYWRIHVGIKGTPMPAAGPAPGAAGVLAPEAIWDVVNYVRSLRSGRVGR